MSLLDPVRPFMSAVHVRGSDNRDSRPQHWSEGRCVDVNADILLAEASPTPHVPLSPRSGSSPARGPLDQSDDVDVWLFPTRSNSALSLSVVFRQFYLRISNA